MFVDTEVKFGDVEYARRVFDKAIHLQVSSRKMKSVFKKYMEFEKRHGTPETVMHVV